MTEFLYVKAKNAYMNYILFKLNKRYYSKILLENETNFYLKSCSNDKLAEKLKKLIKICCQDLFYI